MYADYHGPEGLKRIARRVASYTAILAAGLKDVGRTLCSDSAFDTITVNTGDHTDALLQAARAAGFNLRRASARSVGITLDETTTRDDIVTLWQVFADGQALPDFAPFEKGVALVAVFGALDRERMRLGQIKFAHEQPGGEVHPRRHCPQIHDERGEVV